MIPSSFLHLLPLGLLLDALLGEPRRLHPLVGFGHWANGLESRFNGMHESSGRWRGLLALTVAVAPPVLLTAWLTRRFGTIHWGAEALFQTVMLYLAIGGRSLTDHALAVVEAFHQRGLEAARIQVGYLVSRHTNGLSETQVTIATVESVLENGCDALFGALFWFGIAGAPGVVGYRLVNTLDAMWGYRNDRFRRFGWAAARLDDWLNLPASHLTALTYLAVGRTRTGWQSWHNAPPYKSPNAGRVMAAGAGALGVRIGGPACYHGQWIERPTLGHPDVPAPDWNDIPRAVALVHRGAWLWGVLAVLLGIWHIWLSR
jgi:adenosylcobinamide-phosphate synthase